MKSFAFTIALQAAVTVFAGDLVFSPDPQTLDTIAQGEIRRVVLNGHNASKRSITLETVFSQNTGGENFRFPASIAPAQHFQIAFDLNTAYMEGPFTHRIIAVEPDGKTHLVHVEGVVQAPVRFSHSILDLGYYRPGESRRWVLYAWNPAGKKIALRLHPSHRAYARLQTASVLLDLSDPDNIREGGKTPGLKLTLTVSQLEKAPRQEALKSIRQLIQLETPEFPKATPELLLVGYWN